MLQVNHPSSHRQHNISVSAWVLTQSLASCSNPPKIAHGAGVAFECLCSAVQNLSTAFFWTPTMSMLFVLSISSCDMRSECPQGPV